MSLQPTFQGEVQFRRWSDSSTQGVQITFALPDSSDLEPLKAKAGKRFMAVLVEIGDDEQPVQVPAERFKPGPLCREAIDLCQRPDFWRWLETATTNSDVKGEADAKAIVCGICDVTSRKELDTNKAAGDYFIQAVRLPFMAHMRSKRKVAA